MFILRLQPFELDPDDEHIGTIWQVAEDSPDFTNIVAETDEDNLNLLIKVFDVEATEGRKYYARARTVCQITGLSVWSSIDMEIALNFDDSLSIMQEPKRLRPPEFDTFWDVDSFPISCFKMKLVQPQYVSNVSIIATTWMIRDMDGKLVYINEYNKNNIYELFIDVILDERKVYTLEAMYHSVNNDTSMVGSTIIYTSRSRYTSFVPKYYTDPDDDETAAGTFNDQDNKISIEITIPNTANGSTIEMIRDEVIVNTITDATTYEEDDPDYDGNGVIILRAKSDIEHQEQEEWVYHIFTLLNAPNDLPAHLPLTLG